MTRDELTPNMLDAFANLIEKKKKEKKLKDDFHKVAAHLNRVRKDRAQAIAEVALARRQLDQAFESEQTFKEEG